MSRIDILFTALSLAFCWVHVVNAWLAKNYALHALTPLAAKPFTCVKCMCGWFALLQGCYVYGPAGILLLPAGVFTGAVWEAVCMRWL